MLRFASMMLVFSAGMLTAAPVPKVKVKDADALLGKWVLVELSHNGMGAKEGYQDAVVTFDKATMSVKKATEKEGGEVMRYTLDQDKKRIDFRPNEGANVELQGVYELDGDTLIIAIPMAGKGERPKEAKPGPGIAYLKLQRTKEEKK